MRSKRTAKWASEEPGDRRVATQERPLTGASLKPAPASLSRKAFTTPLFSSRVTVHVA